MAVWDFATLAGWLRVRLLDWWLVLERLRLLVSTDSTFDFLCRFVDGEPAIDRPEVQGIATAVTPKALVNVPLGMHAERPRTALRRRTRGRVRRGGAQRATAAKLIAHSTARSPRHPTQDVFDPQPGPQFAVVVAHDRYSVQVIPSHAGVCSARFAVTRWSGLVLLGPVLAIRLAFEAKHDRTVDHPVKQRHHQRRIA